MESLPDVRWHGTQFHQSLCDAVARLDGQWSNELARSSVRGCITKRYFMRQHEVDQDRSFTSINGRYLVHTRVHEQRNPTHEFRRPHDAPNRLLPSYLLRIWYGIQSRRNSKNEGWLKLQL